MDDSISEATEDNHQRRRRLATLRKRRQRSKNNDDDSIRHTERQRASLRRQNESPERFVDKASDILESSPKAKVQCLVTEQCVVVIAVTLTLGHSYSAQGSTPPTTM